ncbi:MAG: DUF6356 family protein [Acidimicrobiales bacterium]|jgi:hypothetical protein|nr:hypothetical protein [Actinomycetota bacterium]MDP6062960.1 DUF6356 family protein [Acidimicrobiales bacterium]MDP6213805.1 DUF6356 family protein [Acidimicrobiales bacterium]MDP7209795.1 DUF6356 family protein [Acidimicrobiales bacterium]HJO98831.1 DUF6356 family protein [Acidimicrobiales bacterium]|tara:strand:+ start:1648 stop:1863 length:216 start_codon:yes stop_codon:yes gene_type:complete
MKRFFTEHPAEVGETYGQHLGRAVRSAVSLAGAAIACTVHALVPALFVTTASRTITRLSDEIAGLRADDAE